MSLHFYFNDGSEECNWIVTKLEKEVSSSAKKHDLMSFWTAANMEASLEHWNVTNRGNGVWGRMEVEILFTYFLGNNIVIISNFPSRVYITSTFHDAGLANEQSAIATFL